MLLSQKGVFTMVISDNAGRLLESLKLGGADGYTMMKRSGNTAAQLVDAIRGLPPSMLIVKGALNPDEVGESFMVLSPDAKGDASLLLGR
jgi:hypothetical protein